MADNRGHLFEGSTTDLTRYLVEAVVRESRSYRDLAAAHGVSKRWVAKMVGRYREGGCEALRPHSEGAASDRSPTRGWMLERRPSTTT